MVARFCPRRHRRVRMVPSASSTVPPTLSSTRTIFLRRGQHRCPLHFVIHLLTVQSEPSLAFVTFLPPSLSTTTLFSSCFENTASRSAHSELISTNAQAVQRRTACARECWAAHLRARARTPPRAPLSTSARCSYTKRCRSAGQRWWIMRLTFWQNFRTPSNAVTEMFQWQLHRWSDLRPRTHD